MKVSSSVSVQTLVTHMGVCQLILTGGFLIMSAEWVFTGGAEHSRDTAGWSLSACTNTSLRPTGNIPKTAVCFKANTAEKQTQIKRL